MDEGEKGDLFYIILEGACQVLKAAPVPITNERISTWESYLNTFEAHFEMIHWAGMDISKVEI